MGVSTASWVNVSSVLEHGARMQPDRLAVVCGSQRLTYGQINAAANRIANALRRSGIQAGDHVALSCPNLPYFPMAYFGALKAGATVVPLNVLFKPREIAYHLRDSDAKALLCFEGTAELPMAQMARAALDEAPDCRQLVVLPAKPDESPDLAGAVSLQRWWADADTSFETHPTRPDDTAVMLYTSGTTGQPKGAELMHVNLLLNGIYSRDLKLPSMDVRPDGVNVELVTLPLFHSFGQVVQLVSGFYANETLVLLPRFEAEAVVTTMVRECVNIWCAVPTMYWSLLQYVRSSGTDVSAIARNLRVCFSGGAALPVELLKDFEQTFDVRILEGYGLSETSPVANFNQMVRPTKPGTVGPAIQCCEVRVVDEQDRPLPAGTAGEVVIRGHNIMKGYYKRPEATDEALRHGWFHSGDIGVIDDDGYLSIVDRKKDMIIRGGFNVYPREIEELLMTHPAVSLCAVVGIPDERLGEEVKAFVVLKPGTVAAADEIVEWMRPQLAAYKCPRSVELRQTLPMTASGKILKRELRLASGSAG